MELSRYLERALASVREWEQGWGPFEPHLAGETLAVRVGYDGAAGEEATVKGRPLYIAVERA